MLRRAANCKLRLISIHVPEAYDKSVRELIKTGRYVSYGEVVRVAILNLIDGVNRSIYEVSLARSRLKPICG